MMLSAILLFFVVAAAQHVDSEPTNDPSAVYDLLFKKMLESGESPQYSLCMTMATKAQGSPSDAEMLKSLLQATTFLQIIKGKAPHADLLCSNLPTLFIILSALFLFFFIACCCFSCFFMKIRCCGKKPKQTEKKCMRRKRHDKVEMCAQNSPPPHYDA